MFGKHRIYKTPQAIEKFLLNLFNCFSNLIKAIARDGKAIAIFSCDRFLRQIAK
jgi:hypothetical protein